MNRRSLVARTAALLTVTAESPANALSSVQPTALGRALLEAISQYHAGLTKGSLPDAESDEANERLFLTLGALAMRIEARPVTSLERLVDRAILAVACEDGEIETERIMRLVEAVFSGWPEAESLKT
jgi:triphosphoribosyl-dephospho-CoA synthetase